MSFDLLASGVWDPAADIAQGDRRISLIVRITGGEVNTQRAHNLCSSEAGGFDCLIADEVGPIPGRAPQRVIATPEPEIASRIGSGIAALVCAALSRPPRAGGQR